MIKAITKGNNIVQQNDISWSKRILGKEALAHIKTKIIAQALSPRLKPSSIPSIKGSNKKTPLIILYSVKCSQKSKLIY